MSSLVSGAKDIFIGDEQKIAKPIGQFTPLAFGTPGANLSTTQGGINLTRSPQQQAALRGVLGATGQAAQDIGALRPLVAPGFGRLTEAGVQAIRDQRRATTSNLRENLARRRVLGSSFASDTIARAEAESAKQEAQFRAQATLQEIDATNRLIASELDTSLKGLGAVIEQGNFETQIAGQLTQSFNNTMAQLAAFESGILKEQADAQRELFGSVISDFGGFGEVAGGLGDIFSAGAEKVGDIFGFGGGGGSASALGLAGTAAGLGSLGGTASTAIGGSLGFGAGATQQLGNLSSGLSGFGPSALTGPSGEAVFGAASNLGEASFGAFESIGAELGADAGTTAAAEGLVASNPLLSNMALGGLAGSALGAGIAALTGGDVAKGVASGAGAGVGAAIGSAILPGAGTIIGGFLGGTIAGKIGDAIGFSGKGGGEDKADYSVGFNPSGTSYQSGISSDGVWGSVGLGHQKHINNTSAFQSATEAVTKTDEMMSALFTPAQNEAIKREIESSGIIASNSNEGGYSPGRFMDQVFTARAEAIRRAVGDQVFNSLNLGPMYQALASGDQNAINTAFSSLQIPQQNTQTTQTPQQLASTAGTALSGGSALSSIGGIVRSLT